MKLPAITKRQQRQEDARALHEQLWQRYQDLQLLGPLQPDESPMRVFIASKAGEQGQELLRLASNLHRFWNSRGFRFRCRQSANPCGFYVWIEAFTDTPEPAYSRVSWQTEATIA